MPATNVEQSNAPVFHARGLFPGERVIVYPSDRIASGARVEVH
jgi:hypothetical protein